MKSAAAFLVPIALTLAASAAHADVYKWTDANGTVHYSDAAADARAQRILLRKANQSLAVHDGYAVDQPATASAPHPNNNVAPPTASAAPKKPSRAERLAAYQASQECFERFRNANATMKPEAFSVCTELKDPNGEQQRP